MTSAAAALGNSKNLDIGGLGLNSTEVQGISIVGSTSEFCHLNPCVTYNTYALHLRKVSRGRLIIYWRATILKMILSWGADHRRVRIVR